jgi:hypothetical protein
MPVQSTECLPCNHKQALRISFGIRRHNGFRGQGSRYLKEGSAQHRQHPMHSSGLEGSCSFIYLFTHQVPAPSPCTHQDKRGVVALFLSSLIRYLLRDRTSLIRYLLRDRTGAWNPGEGVLCIGRCPPHHICKPLLDDCVHLGPAEPLGIVRGDVDAGTLWLAIHGRGEELQLFKSP